MKRSRRLSSDARLLRGDSLAKLGGVSRALLAEARFAERLGHVEEVRCGVRTAQAEVDASTIVVGNVVDEARSGQTNSGERCGLLSEDDIQHGGCFGVSTGIDQIDD